MKKLKTHLKSFLDEGLTKCGLCIYNNNGIEIKHIIGENNMFKVTCKNCLASYNKYIEGEPKVEVSVPKKKEDNYFIILTNDTGDVGDFLYNYNKTELEKEINSLLKEGVDFEDISVIRGEIVEFDIETVVKIKD